MKGLGSTDEDSLKWQRKFLKSEKEECSGNNHRNKNCTPLSFMGSGCRRGACRWQREEPRAEGRACLLPENHTALKKRQTCREPGVSAQRPDVRLETGPAVDCLAAQGLGDRANGPHSGTRSSSALHEVPFCFVTFPPAPVYQTCTLIRDLEQVM